MAVRLTNYVGRLRSNTLHKPSVTDVIYLVVKNLLNYRKEKKDETKKDSSYYNSSTFVQYNSFGMSRCLSS